MFTIGFSYNFLSIALKNGMNELDYTQEGSWMVNSLEKLYMEKLGKFHPTPKQKDKSE